MDVRLSVMGIVGAGLLLWGCSSPSPQPNRNVTAADAGGWDVVTPTAPAQPAPPAATPDPGAQPPPGVPAALGVTQSIVMMEFPYESFQLRVTVVSVSRGREAWQRIKDGDFHSNPPDPGYEYVTAWIRVEYHRGVWPPAPFEINTYKFAAVSSAGNDYVNKIVISPKPALDGKLYPGTVTEGWAVFQVAENDYRPLLVFGRDRQGQGGLWWKLF